MNYTTGDNYWTCPNCGQWVSGYHYCPNQWPVYYPPQHSPTYLPGYNLTEPETKELLKRIVELLEKLTDK